MNLDDDIAKLKQMRELLQECLKLKKSLLEFALNEQNESPFTIMLRQSAPMDTSFTFTSPNGALLLH